MIPKVEEQHLLGTRSCINSELWRACAGPLVNLPAIGSLVYYFPQGHSEQVAISTRGTSISQIPNYANLSSQLLCQVHKVTMHADKGTDEIYAQMNLQPVNSECDVIPVPENSVEPIKHPAEFFCKTLTASDTSTHGGFSIPRRAAEKLFPPLDLAVQPPSQELLFRDLHNSAWPFRHIYRGQPKRHLLTSGWSLFVGAKRLKAGDAVLFVRDENSSLLIGIRRTVRQPTALPSSVLSADSMHIGILAAAAQASATNTPFKVYYNPRSCMSEFIVPLVKYRKAVYGAKLSYGTRFGMMFETEESSKRRCMGTIVGISDLDPFRWPGSKWRNLQVEWDEPGCSDKVTRVSAWDIDTPESYRVFSSPLKRPPPPSDSDWSDFRKRREVVLNQTPANSIIFSGEAPPFQNPLDLSAIDCWLKEETDEFRNPNSEVLDPVRMLEETMISPIPYFDGFLPQDRHSFDYSNPLAVYTAAGCQPPEIHNSTSANFCSSQDVQSQITSGSVIAASSGGGSSAGDCSFLPNRPRPVPPPIRTYTKVQKTGSVGRCVDVSGFGNYEELRRAIEGMFGLEGLLNDTCRSGWKLVYVDYENDVLLVGDDPWEEFVGCVRCIRILSPPEVQRMSEDGAHQLAYS